MTDDIVRNPDIVTSCLYWPCSHDQHQDCSQRGPIFTAIAPDNMAGKLVEMRCSCHCHRQQPIRPLRMEDWIR